MRWAACMSLTSLTVSVDVQRCHERRNNHDDGDGDGDGDGCIHFAEVA